MAKLLVIRKPDKTIHKIPMSNKAAAMAFSNKLPAGLKWKFEEMEEEDALKLPFLDTKYITASDAQSVVKEKDQLISDKDKQIAELEAKIAALSAGSETATQKIDRINAADSADTVKEILGADDRKTVIDAAAKKTASFPTINS